MQTSALIKSKVTKGVERNLHLCFNIEYSSWFICFWIEERIRNNSAGNGGIPICKTRHFQLALEYPKGVAEFLKGSKIHFEYMRKILMLVCISWIITKLKRALRCLRHHQLPCPLHSTFTEYNVTI